MLKKFISINLNQSESKETIREKWQERSRWVIFYVLTALLIFANGDTWWIGRGYTKLIKQKTEEIEDVKQQINALRAQGKNISKSDILSLAKLENNRILWARNMQIIGETTPDDMAITSMKYRKNKLIIGGVAVVYEDRKDFNIVHVYINALKHNKLLNENFSRIKFNQGSLNTFRGQKVVEFEIEAMLKIAQKNNGIAS